MKVPYNAEKRVEIIGDPTFSQPFIHTSEAKVNEIFSREKSTVLMKPRTITGQIRV